MLTLAPRPPVWNKTRFVPRGYALRIPGSPPPADIAAAWARLPPAERFVAQRNDGAHRVRRGETLASIAAVSGVTLNRLLAANGFSGVRAIARGETVRIPMPASRAEGAAPAIAAAATAAATSAPETLAAATATPAPPEAAAALLGPVRLAAPPRSRFRSSRLRAPRCCRRRPLPATAIPTDYSVGADNTVVVQAAETLGHFADWSKVSSASLRTLNRLHKRAMVTLGHKVKLDLSQASAAQFEAARREYHRQLQETFFATHRISGTENYVVKRKANRCGSSPNSIRTCPYGWSPNTIPMWILVTYDPARRLLCRGSRTSIVSDAARMQVVGQRFARVAGGHEVHHGIVRRAATLSPSFSLAAICLSISTVSSK